MRTDANRKAKADSAEAVTVRVQRTVRGRWEVVMPGRGEGIACETLDDARRVAYLAVAHTHPCELIVRDACHRVIERELIDGYQAVQTRSPPTGEQQGETTVAPEGAQPSRSRENRVEPIGTGRRLTGLRKRRSASARSRQPIQKGGQ